MILAVNTESFLDITYDEAALILKQVTGNVRILVVNPKDEEELTTMSSPNKASVPDQKSMNTLSPDHKAAPESPAAKKSPIKDVKSPIKTPAKSPVKKDDNIIELKKDANGLGISIVGGSDTPLVSCYVIYRHGQPIPE